jgi:hypothetical protein
VIPVFALARQRIRSGDARFLLMFPVIHSWQCGEQTIYARCLI